MPNSQSESTSIETTNNQMLKFDVSQGDRNFCTQMTLHRIFEINVQDKPNKVAICFEGETITYSDLNDKANRLAKHLQSIVYSDEIKNTSTGEHFIGIYFDKNIDAIISIFAVLKAGFAYVPINPKDPITRLQYILEDTRSRVLLTQNHYVDQVKQAIDLVSASGFVKTHIVDINEIELKGYDTKNLTTSSAGSDLAYVIYTSGTTGRPKGVMIEHKSVLNLAYSRRKDFDINEDSRVLQFSPMSFDASVCEIFSALINYSTLILISDEQKGDDAQLVRYLNEQRVTVATILPSMLAHIKVASKNPLPNLSTLIVAGETCSKDVISRWNRNRSLINAYGPTETTVCATVNRFEESDSATTLGLPIQNTLIFVLDENFKPVPLGSIGEIFIGGIGLARGYLNKPELTIEKFVEIPLANKENGVPETQRFYRTGDLGKQLTNGKIEFLGRSDSQVKIRGYRIEIGEIQSALSNFSLLNQVYVTVWSKRQRPNGHGNDVQKSENKNIVAYYTSKDLLQRETFLAYLSKYLPEYMFPKFFVHIDKFPVTNNGKIDLQQLPDPLIKVIEPLSMPRNEIEQELLNIWIDVLDTDQIDCTDNFFYVGGDSLLVLRLANLINIRFETKISVTHLYEKKDIREQSKLVEHHKKNRGKFEPICTFQEKGNKPPLFFIHPSLSGPELYMKMLDWFDYDQPFYGVESYNLNHLDSPETDLSYLAKRYVEYIFDAQPNGPHFIGGYSLGGNIAYEVANQIIKQGGDVGGLYLIDSVLPSPLAKDKTITDKDARSFLEYFGFNSNSDPKLLELVKVEMKLLFSYSPKSKLPLKIVLLKAKNLLSTLGNLDRNHIVHSFFQTNELYSGWDKFAREVNRYDIDANHETIMDIHNIGKVSKIIQEDIKTHEIKEMLDFWS